MAEHHIEDQFPTAGDAAASRAFTQQPRLIIIHSTRSTHGEFTLDQELRSTLNSYKTGGDNSSHCVIAGNGDVHWTVALDRMAWGARYLNARALHIEVCQPTREYEFTDDQYRGTALAVQRIVERYPDIPFVHTLDEAATGYIGHEETRQGQQAGKSDPGLKWDWGKFEAAYQGLRGGNGEGMATIIDALNVIWAKLDAIQQRAGPGEITNLAEDAKQQGVVEIKKAIGLP